MGPDPSTVEALVGHEWHQTDLKSINWKGIIENDELSTPSDDQFKEHFEHLLSFQDVQYDDDYVNSPRMPALDDPLTIEELS